jgi:hypothetical protein
LSHFGDIAGKLGTRARLEHIGAIALHRLENAAACSTGTAEQSDHVAQDAVRRSAL